MAGGDNHICGSAMTAEAVPAFQQEFLFEMIDQAVEKNETEDFLGDDEQRDVLVFVADLTIPFALIKMDDLVVLEAQRDFFLMPRLLDERRQVFGKLGPPCMWIIARIA
nr:unnamed protein product [Spirometra erinaceieuropaei]